MSKDVLLPLQFCGQLISVISYEPGTLSFTPVALEAMAKASMHYGNLSFTSISGMHFCIVPGWWTKTSSGVGIVPSINCISVGRIASNLTLLLSLAIGYLCPTLGRVSASLATCCRGLKLLSLEADVGFQTFADLPNNIAFKELRELGVRTSQLSPELSSAQRLEWQVRRLGDASKVKTPRLHHIHQTENSTGPEEDFLRQICPSKFQLRHIIVEQPSTTAQRDILRNAAWAPFS